MFVKAGELEGEERDIGGWLTGGIQQVSWHEWRGTVRGIRWGEVVRLAGRVT